MVYLYDDEMALIAANDDYDSVYGEIHDEGLPPGTYYVEVENVGGGPLQVHLSVSESP